MFKAKTLETFQICKILSRMDSMSAMESSKEVVEISKMHLEIWNNCVFCVLSLNVQGESFGHL